MAPVETATDQAGRDLQELSVKDEIATEHSDCDLTNLLIYFRRWFGEGLPCDNRWRKLREYETATVKSVRDL